MSFRWYVYYCSTLGGCAAFVGWFLGRMIGSPQHVVQASLRGMLLGMCIAVVLTLVDLFWNLSARSIGETSLRVLIAGIVGGLGGFVGGFVGQILYGSTQWSTFLILGWTITGILIGLSIGLFDLLTCLAQNKESQSARRKTLHGVLGGTLGGLLGGVVFLVFGHFWSFLLGPRAELFLSPSATGFVALGVLIGLMIGLAQVLLKSAWVTVVSGFGAGRELMLSQDVTILGRAEGCDVPLYGDAEAAGKHAQISLRDGDYFLDDLGSEGGTFVNGRRVTSSVQLRSGDLIEVGRSSLRFGERVKPS